MTISIAPARNEYTSNAGQTIFNYTFKIFESTDLNVYITPSGQDANDSTDLTTAYTVTGLGDEDGGTIILSVGTNANDLVTIVSDVPSSRTVDYQNNGDFRPDTVNDDFDRVVSIVKKIEDTANRAALLQQSQQDPKPLTLPTPISQALMRWKSDLSGFENVNVSELSPGLFPNDGITLNSTLSAVVNDTELLVGQVYVLSDRDNSLCDIVLSSSVTENTYNIVQCIGVPTLSVVLRGISDTTAIRYGFVNDGITDNTGALQHVVSNTDVNKITFGKGVYYFAGGANTALINRSDLEIVFEAGSTLIQDNTGALFWVGESSNVSNITFTGKGGKIRNPISAHPFETTGILVGASGKTVDKFTMTNMDILMSKYGLANGSQSAIITNMSITEGNKLTVNMNGWATGSDIGQAFEMNLPGTSAGIPNAVITGNFFTMINQSSSKGDAFKWTNGVLNFSDNQCILDGQGQTVAVHSSMYQGSKIHSNSYKVINGSGTIEDALQINNSVGAVFSDLTAIVGASFGGGIQIGTNTDCELKDLVTNETIRQTSGTTCTDCILDGYVASQLLLTQATAIWNGGAIKNGELKGQCFITSNNCDIENNVSDMGGQALRALYVRGDGNTVKTFTAKNNISTQAVQVEGDNNLVIGLVLVNCHSSWYVVSGFNNKFGRVAFQAPITASAQNFIDNGGSTGFVQQIIGGLTGTLTLEAPSNPDGETTIEVTFLSGNTTVTNITGAKDKDLVKIYLTGASNNLTFNRDNAKLDGGVNFVGNQWDMLVLKYDESSSVWIEQSRTQNS